MAAMTAAGIDFDHDAWTLPDDKVQPSEDLADPYREGFDRYLTTVEATRGLWDRLRAGPPHP
jgi:hypothetical protein